MVPMHAKNRKEALHEPRRAALSRLPVRGAFQRPVPGSWSQCGIWLSWRLSMNRTDSGSFGLEQHIVFAGELLEETLFGLSDFFFVLFESLLDVRPAVNHQAPEQLGQLASQG